MHEQVSIDLIEDFRFLILEKLHGFGFQPNPKERINLLYAKYLNFCKRAVSQVPRKVYISSEISNANMPENIKSAFEEIVLRARTGLDLNIFLSKNLRKFEYQDQLINDWGIHHLHLNLEQTTDSFFKDGSKELLFAKIEENKIYFICIQDHKSFSDQNMLNILNKNWPETLAQFKNGALTGTRRDENLSADDLHQARRAGLCTIITLENGSVLFPPGGGITTAGTNISVQIQSSRFLSYLFNVQKNICANLDKFRNEIKLQGFRLPEKLSFQLQIEESKILILETNTQVLFEVGDTATINRAR